MLVGKRYVMSQKRKACNSRLADLGGNGKIQRPMRVAIGMFFLWASCLWGQENSSSSSGGRLTVVGGSAELRVVMVQDAERLIRELDGLVGEVAGDPKPIFLEILPNGGNAMAMVSRSLLTLEDVVGEYRLQINLQLGRGGEFDRSILDRVLIEMLLIERTLRSLPEGENAEQVEVRPWLIDGISEAILWQQGKGDRRMYQSLMESGGWVEVEALVDRQRVGDLDGLGRELFRASSGALVMALLSQTEGKKSFGLFLEKVAVFEGEQMTLLRTHFPQVNLGAKGIERWWMLQVAAMSEKPLSEAMTIPETEAKLAKALQIHLPMGEGKVRLVGIEDWAEVVALESRDDRLRALRPASDLLSHLSFRCFPTYRPVIGGYLQILANLVEEKDEETAVALENLKTFREAEGRRYEQLIDLMDWFHLSTVKEESGEFDEFLRIRKQIKAEDVQSDDPLNRYLNQVEGIFERDR